MKVSISEKRRIYVNDNCVLVASHPDYGIEAFLDADRAVALVFSGRRSKPDLYCRYKTSSDARVALERYVNSVIERRSRMKLARAQSRNLVIGDVLYCSWGYDQTNVEFYQVVDLVGKMTVVLREIAQERKCQQQDAGKCVPVPGDFIGDTFRRRVLRGDSVKISGGQRAYKFEPRDLGNGVKVYDAKYWSSYA